MYSVSQVHAQTHKHTNTHTHTHTCSRGVSGSLRERTVKRRNTATIEATATQYVNIYEYYDIELHKRTHKHTLTHDTRREKAEYFYHRGNCYNKNGETQKVC
jgi:hypothetical protein